MAVSFSPQLHASNVLGLLCSSFGKEWFGISFLYEKLVVVFFGIRVYDWACRHPAHPVLIDIPYPPTHSSPTQHPIVLPAVEETEFQAGLRHVAQLGREKGEKWD